MTCNVTIQKGMQASRPVLVFIDKIINTFPKTTFIIYYKNPIYQDDQVYRNIDDLKELFLPNRQLYLKIINFQKQEEPVIIKNTNWQCSDNKIIIKFNYQTFNIILYGNILNQSQSNEGLVNLSLAENKGYDNFYKYRKKYKTLENITKKIQFKIDHRVKIIISGKEYQFDLQDKKKQHYFLNVGCFEQSFTIVLEQTTSIQDFVNVDKVQQLQANINMLKQLNNSYYAKVKFSHNFQLKFQFNLIKNQNLTTADFVAIRVLQTSSKASNIKIGTQHTIHLNDCLSIKPLIGNKYFDYQWGYLNDNLTQIQGGTNIYEYLQKITKSVPKYAHFTNQQVIDLSQSNFLIFDVDGNRMKVPIALVLKGFNFIENDKMSLKFYIDSSRLQQKSSVSQDSDRKRIFELNIQQIWNLNKLNKLLDKNNTNEFQMKIIYQDTYYFIPFQRKTVNKSQFRKESKQLVMRNEIVQRNQNKYYSIQNKNNDQLTLIQSQSIHPFYLIKFTSSASLSIQIIISNSIALEGSLTKQKIIGTSGQPLIHLLASVQGNTKMGIIFNFVQIQQPYQSAATFYNFKHRLYFAEAGQTEEITYDIEIEFDKDSKNRSLKSKLTPEIKKETNDPIILRDFLNNSGVYRKQQSLNFTLKLRKMYFNNELNYFDNEILLFKQIFINPTSNSNKENTVIIRVDKQCYKGLQFDLYDLNIKKRMKYYIQIYAEKNQFLDYKDSSYKIRIPNLLWNFNNVFQQNCTSYQIATHLNRKNKNTDKFTFAANYTQDISLNHYNFNDGISLVKTEDSVSYSKFIKAIKIKCDILKDKIGWSPQGQWFFGVLSFSHSNFYFLAQRMFDPYQEKKNNSSSVDSKKTVSRQRSNRSDKHKIDPLAKTISNLDLFKLKQKKNQLIAQGRQLTARYVKRQEKIVELTKKLSELDQQIKKKEQQQSEIKTDKKKFKKQNVKMKEFYRSICQCGARNPQFNGYCDSCLKKLKEKYQTYTKQYNGKCYQYQKIVFEKFNQKQKIQKLKNKIYNMKNQNIVFEADDDAPQLLIKDLQQKSLKRNIEELKIQIFQIQQQKASLISTSNWQMSILQEKIGKEDEIIYKASQQYDSLKNKLADLLKTTKKTDQIQIDDI